LGTFDVEDMSALFNAISNYDSDTFDGNTGMDIMANGDIAKLAEGETWMRSEATTVCYIALQLPTFRSSLRSSTHPQSQPFSRLAYLFASLFAGTFQCLGSASNCASDTR